MTRPFRLLMAAIVALSVTVGLAHAPLAPAHADAPSSYLVGRGIADITGEAAENGLMGYGRFDQQAQGIQSRQHARSFIIAEPQSGKRVLLVVAEIAMTFDSVHQAVIKRLAAKYGDTYTWSNTMIQGTHTHAAPGGFSHHVLYNITTKGFHEDTFNSLVDGIVESVDRAHADLKPAALSLGVTALTNASAQRSAPAFDNNAADIRAFFPNKIDTQSTNLMVRDGNKLTGVLNWFGVHATSLSSENKLISTDNKGYASWLWEQENKVDYLADNPNFIAAFAQNNTADMSPNLDLTPPRSPADFPRALDAGHKQFDAAKKIADAPATQVRGPIDSRKIYLDFENIAVTPEFTGDGQTHTTCQAVVGAAMPAGSVEDGPASDMFKEGNNPFFAKASKVAYTFDPVLKDCQSPKDMLINAHMMNQLDPWVQTRLPIQLIRIGQLYLLGYPGELTIGSGFRLRQAVSKVVGQPIQNVIMASYANAYNHYMTTPEEYDLQHYEGGSTFFGRWQTPAMAQEFSKLATAMRDGVDVPLGEVSQDLSNKQIIKATGVVFDIPISGHKYGDVLTQPTTTARGKTASAVFVGAHPKNDLRRGGSYIEVQKLVDGQWVRVADDNSWLTRFHWERVAAARSKITAEWDVPTGAEPGTYRFVYHGMSKIFVTLTPFDGATEPFEVR